MRGHFWQDTLPSINQPSFSIHSQHLFRPQNSPNPNGYTLPLSGGYRELTVPPPPHLPSSESHQLSLDPCSRHTPYVAPIRTSHSHLPSAGWPHPPLKAPLSPQPSPAGNMCHLSHSSKVIFCHQLYAYIVCLGTDNTIAIRTSQSLRNNPSHS
jgi:hypothetical protein